MSDPLHASAARPLNWISQVGHSHLPQNGQRLPQQPVLDVVQQPVQARVTRRDRPKFRFNLEPPPIVRLRYHSFNQVGLQKLLNTEGGDSYKLNPRFFLLASLLDASDAEGSRAPIKDQRLLGSPIASSHSLRNEDPRGNSNVDLEDGVFFVFGDLSCTVEGRYILRFDLFEFREDGTEFLTSTTSAVFEITATKDWIGRPNATPLSLSCHNQGVRLKIRKTVRKRRRSSEPDDDYENDRGAIDEQRAKYKRLVPKDRDTTLHRSAPRSLQQNIGTMDRQDLFQRWMHSHDAATPPPNPNGNKQNLSLTPTPYSLNRFPADAQHSESVVPAAGSLYLTPYAQHTAVNPSSHATNNPGNCAPVKNSSYTPNSDSAISNHATIPNQQQHDSPHGIWWTLTEKHRWDGQVRTSLPPATQDLPLQGLALTQAMTPNPHFSIAPWAANEYRKDSIEPPAFFTDDWDFVGFSIPSPTILRTRAAY